MLIVSVDVETTGLDPEKCQVIQLAMIIEDSANPLPREECPTLNLIVRHPEYVCNDPKAFALSLNGWIFDRLRGVKLCDERDKIEIVNGDVIPVKVLRFLVEHAKFKKNDKGHDKQVKYVLAGKNVAGFDRPFLENLFSSNPTCAQEIWRMFPHRVMDPGPMFARSSDAVPPDLKECLKRACISKEVSHYADDDAWDVIECLRFAEKERLELIGYRVQEALVGG